jgi:hypothetical protein
MAASDVASSVFTYSPDEDSWCISLGWQIAGLEFFFDDLKFSPEVNAKGAEKRREVLAGLSVLLAEHGIALPDERDFHSLVNRLAEDLARRGISHIALFQLGTLGFRVSLAQDCTPVNEEMLTWVGSTIAGIRGLDDELKHRIFKLMLERRVSSAADVDAILIELCKVVGPEPGGSRNRIILEVSGIVTLVAAAVWAYFLRGRDLAEMSTLQGIAAGFLAFLAIPALVASILAIPRGGARSHRWSARRQRSRNSPRRG